MQGYNSIKTLKLALILPALAALAAIGCGGGVQGDGSEFARRGLDSRGQGGDERPLATPRPRGGSDQSRPVNGSSSYSQMKTAAQRAVVGAITLGSNSIESGSEDQDEAVRQSLSRTTSTNSVSYTVNVRAAELLPPTALTSSRERKATIQAPQRQI